MNLNNTKLLPSNIVLKIYNEYIVDIDILENSLCLSKEFKEPICNLYTKCKKYNYIIDNFPPHIIDTFGGIDKFITYPVIDFKNEHMGGTMYLDRFLLSDVSESITIGIDYCRRPFVILNLEFEYDFDSIPEISREYYNRKDKHSGVATVFQRYTDSSSGWTTASAYMHMQDVFQTGMLMDETYLSIKELIDKKQVSMNIRKIKLL